MTEPTRETPAITPEVTTAPAGSAWSRIPDHLGPARTSTVILGVLFLGLFALYLYIRPETVATTPATTGNAGAVVEEPATPTTAVPETTAPQTTTAPDTTRQDSTPTTTATTSEVP